VQGIRFGDVARLRWSDIKGDAVMMEGLQKGKKDLSLQLHSRLKAILEYYKPITGGKKGKGFVFPFLDYLPEDPLERKGVIGSRNTVVNRNLKTVASLAEVDKVLSFHISRHTFAQHLKEKKKDIHVIKEALKHEKITTTEKYLAALGNERLNAELKDLYEE
jgi:integrase